MAEDYNSVPLGQAGTGAAFILGQSQAAKNVADTIAYNRKIEQQNALLKQRQAQQIAQDWKTNALKVDGGLYWQPDFNKRYQQHVEKGIQLRQMGVDPFNYNANDPNQSKIAEDYLLERQGLVSDAANRKATESEVKKSFDLIRKDPNKYYSSDIEGLNKYVNTPYEQAKNMDIPTLEERFNPNELLAKVTPAQDGTDFIIGDKRIKSVKALVPETRDAILNRFNNDPASARYVNEMTGNQGFTISKLEAIPNTKEAIKENKQAEYEGDPNLRIKLAQEAGKQGISVSEARDKYIDQETDRLYDAKNKWNTAVDGYLTQVLPKVHTSSSITPDHTEEDQAMQRERLQLAREAAERDKIRLNESGKTKAQDPTFWQNKVNDIIDKKPGSGEYLFDSIKSNILKKDQTINGRVRLITNDNGTQTIVIPEVIKKDVTRDGTNDKSNETTKIKVIKPEKRVNLNPNDREGSARALTNILNIYTEANEPYSKQFTPSGKGKVPGGQTEKDLKKQTSPKFIGIPKGGF